MAEIDELRSKLRDKRGTGSLTPPAPRRKKRPKPKPKQQSVIAGLDVNRKMLFAALGIAAVASLLAVMYLSQAGEGIMDGATKIDVVVPADDIPARTMLTKDLIEKRTMPKGLLPKGYFTKEADAVGKVSLAPLVKGEVLLDVRVSLPNEETGVSPKLKPNERGFSLSVDDASELSLVKPDDYVDLIANISDANERTISSTVLQLVRVIGVGNRFSPNASPQPGYDSSNTLTLAVPVNKVSLMTAIREKGKLRVMLRSPGDTTIRTPEVPESEISRWVMGKVPPVVHSRPAAPVVRQPETRVIYRQQPAQSRPVVRVVQPKPRPAAPKKPHVGIEVY